LVTILSKFMTIVSNTSPIRIQTNRANITCCKQEKRGTRMKNTEQKDMDQVEKLTDKQQESIKEVLTRIYEDQYNVIIIRKGKEPA